MLLFTCYAIQQNLSDSFNDTVNGQNFIKKKWLKLCWKLSLQNFKSITKSFVDNIFGDDGNDGVTKQHFIATPLGQNKKKNAVT